MRKRVALEYSPGRWRLLITSLVCPNDEKVFINIVSQMRQIARALVEYAAGRRAVLPAAVIGAGKPLSSLIKSLFHGISDNKRPRMIQDDSDDDFETLAASGSVQDHQVNPKA